MGRQGGGPERGDDACVDHEGDVELCLLQASRYADVEDATGVATAKGSLLERNPAERALSRHQHAGDEQGADDAGDREAEPGAQYFEPRERPRAVDQHVCSDTVDDVDDHTDDHRRSRIAGALLRGVAGEDE